MKGFAAATVLAAAIAGSAGFGAPIETELACRSLPAFPWAHHVQLYGPEDSVSLAVDPARHPALAGATCDVFVVEAKDAAAWAADPALADVRPDGAQRVTFDGATIAQNIVELAAARGLSADAGYRLGVAYDVVLDCDLDGTLGDADAIDGAGDAVGLWTVHDTTEPGLLRTVQHDEPGGAYDVKRLFYPEDLALIGPQPLVTIGHGWTLDHTMYDYIGQHLASYGYVVMTHGNSTLNGGPPGTDAAASTTLGNIDQLLGALPTIAAGALDGLVDGGRIAMLGHSTGGEAVVRAYTMLRDDPSLTTHFDADDIALLVPIAPVAWLTPAEVDPADVPFHLFGGAADIDTSNAPYDSYTQLFTIYERSHGPKHATYIHGAGHLDFSSGSPSSWADGPELIGRAETQRVVRGYLVPLLELYLRGNVAGREFFTRAGDEFRPSGIAPAVTIVNEFADSAASRTVVLDDFQSQPTTGTSSAGAPVEFDASNVVELLMRDVDGSLAWNGFQPANGMTRARQPGENERCVIFDWAFGETVFYEIGVPPGQRDFTDDGVLSFRAAQGTRHPATELLDEPLTLTVTLSDTAGESRSIRSAAFGTVSRPYRRSGLGEGAGWANEFTTMRLPLSAFAADGGSIDLTSIATVRFEFGQGAGSRVGRLAIDDVLLADGPAPAPFVLRLGRVGETSELGWPPQPEASDYRVARGTLPAGGLPARGSGVGVYDHACIAAGVLSASDADPVPAGAAGFYYLVGVVDGAGEVTFGAASVDLDPALAGTQPERPAGAPCP